ncbi:hypothetical protein E0E54_01515 [Azotobacter chroococcum]|uniref:hypothetical protein n=1 Tax=Azotobacter chroococcum TaxID=353 RepID=UPI0010396D2B|nr:hypothetical protein [Azotobacter chroococcum]TBW39869.1 hypothetical protein E0E54_01515 [Azotobacter chroococcum]
MALTTFRGEKSLSELADKLFVRLTPRQREKAEAALLKANPQLAGLSTLRTGTVLQVPDLPELSAKARHIEENPHSQLITRLSAELKDFGTHLERRHQAAQRAVEDTDRVLANDDELTKLIGQDKTLQELIKNIGTANAERKETLAKRQRRLSTALGKVLGELEKR